MALPFGRRLASCPPSVLTVAFLPLQLLPLHLSLTGQYLLPAHLSIFLLLNCVVFLHLYFINCTNQLKTLSSQYKLLERRTWMDGDRLALGSYFPNTHMVIRARGFLLQRRQHHFTGYMFTKVSLKMELPFPKLNWFYMQITLSPMFK